MEPAELIVPRQRALKHVQVREHVRGLIEAQPPGYRKAAAWWVMQAKQEETRDRRFLKLVQSSGAGRRIS